MRRTAGLLWMLGALVALVACGDDGVTPVTPDASTSDTVAPTTSASPDGGVSRALPQVTLNADEPATIYYTTDGTAPTTASARGESPLVVTGLTAGMPLTFFGADAAGNQEAPHAVTFAVDRLGPATIESFKAVGSGADIALTWTNPTAAGFTDVVIARVTDVAGTVPADGSAPSVGATLGAGKVVFVGAGTSFTDAAPGLGRHTYVGWARYGNGVFAEGRSAGARLAAPTQTFSITLDLTAGTAAVTSQPTAWTLATTNYVNTAGVVTFDLAATSRLAGLAFNPKLVVRTITGGGSTPTFDNTDGTVDVGAGAEPYRYFGPSAIDLDGSATRSLQVTANGATTITISGVLVISQGIYYPDWCAGADGGGLYDVTARRAFPGLPVPMRASAATGRTCTQWSSMLVSPDGRFLYLAERSGRRVVKVDTTTLATVAAIELATTSVSASSRIVLDPSGRRLYAALNDGSHGGGNRVGPPDATHSNTATTEALIVELATTDLTQLTRTSLGTGDHLRRFLRIALSPDARTIGAVLGTMGIATSNSELHLLNASTWADATVPLQGLRGPNMSFDGTGRYMIVGSPGNGPGTEESNFGIVDVAARTLTPHVVPDGRVTTGVPVGDKILLLLTATTQPQLLDPATGVMTPTSALTPSTHMQAAAIGEDGTTLYVVSGNGLLVGDVTTGALTAVTGTGQEPEYMHTIPLTP
jgi:hypothetical protein